MAKITFSVWLSSGGARSTCIPFQEANHGVRVLCNNAFFEPDSKVICYIDKPCGGRLKAGFICHVPSNLKFVKTSSLFRVARVKLSKDLGLKEGATLAKQLRIIYNMELLHGKAAFAANIIKMIALYVHGGLGFDIGVRWKQPIYDEVAKIVRENGKHCSFGSVPCILFSDASQEAGRKLLKSLQAVQSAYTAPLEEWLKHHEIGEGFEPPFPSTAPMSLQKKRFQNLKKAKFEERVNRFIKNAVELLDFASKTGALSGEEKGRFHAVQDCIFGYNAIGAAMDCTHVFDVQNLYTLRHTHSHYPERERHKIKAYFEANPHIIDSRLLTPKDKQRLKIVTVGYFFNGFKGAKINRRKFFLLLNYFFVKRCFSLFL